MKVHRFFINQIKGKCFVYAVFATFLLTIALAAQFVPYAFQKYLIDDIILKKDLHGFYYFVIAYILTIVIIQYLGLSKLYAFNKLTVKTKKILNTTIYLKVLNNSRKYFKNNALGYIVSRITDDVDNASNYFNIMLKGFYGEILMLIFSFGMIFYINWKIAFVFILLLPFYMLNYVISTKKIRHLNLDMMQSIAEYKKTVTESILGVNVLKFFNSFHYMFRKFESKNEDSLHKDLKLKKRMHISSFFDGNISFLAEIIVILFGASKIISGEITLGEFTVFVSVVQSAMPPLRNIMMANMQLQGIRSAHKRITEVLQENDEGLHRGKRVLDEIDEIKIENVSLAYEKGPVLKDYNNVFTKGKKYLIIGDNGIGKSSLLYVLNGYCDDHIQGTICFNGIDFREFTLESLRDHVGLLEQQTFLFDDTIYSNITFDNDKKDKSVVKLADNVFRDIDIYSHTIGENGSKLSGGQRQMVALLRFLYNKPKSVVLLDEMTTGLDKDNKKLIFTTLFEGDILKDEIVIAVSHDMEYKEYFDEICDFGDKNIVN